MKIIQFITDALGDASYLVVAHGAAATIDPQRDIRPYLQAAEEHGVPITHVFETHVHNDYISGGPELVDRGATVVAPVNSLLGFPHTPIAEGDEIAFGGARLRAIAAPGHTYEHTAYLAINEAGLTQGVFTGGAVLMAAVGRSDLLGPDHTDELTRLQWQTARRLRQLLKPEAEVLPTHGAGSFCSSSGADVGRRGPLSEELRRNPAFTSPNFEAFKSTHLATPAPVPAYYRHMAPINRSGPRLYGARPPVPALLDAEGIARAANDGATVLDLRRRDEYADGHIPIAISAEESGSLVAYVSWLTPFNSPLALVSRDAQQAERTTVDLFRIGYEDVRGYLPHEAWLAAGLDIATLDTVDVEEATRIVESGSMPVLDVRFRYEHESSPLPNALELPIDRLPDWADEAPAGPSLVVCGSGLRAMTAGSFLARRGKQVVVLTPGGADDILQRLKSTSAAS